MSEIGNLDFPLSLKILTGGALPGSIWKGSVSCVVELSVGKVRMCAKFRRA